MTVRVRISWGVLSLAAIVAKGERLIIGPDLELEKAILNHELYWRKCEPNNDARFRNALPIVTKEELQAIKTQRQKPFLKGKT